MRYSTGLQHGSQHPSWVICQHLLPQPAVTWWRRDVSGPGHGGESSICVLCWFQLWGACLKFVSTYPGIFSGGSGSQGVFTLRRHTRGTLKKDVRLYVEAIWLMPQDLGRDEEGMVVNSSPREACGPSGNSQRLSVVSVCVCISLRRASTYVKILKGNRYPGIKDQRGKTCMMRLKPKFMCRIWGHLILCHLSLTLSEGTLYKLCMVIATHLLESVLRTSKDFLPSTFILIFPTANGLRPTLFYTPSLGLSKTQGPKSSLCWWQHQFPSSPDPFREFQDLPTNCISV